MSSHAHAELTAFCEHCRRLVAARKRPIRHLQHLKLCVITLGLWFPIWLLLCFSPREVVCSECGGTIDGPRCSENATVARRKKAGKAT